MLNRLPGSEMSDQLRRLVLLDGAGIARDLGWSLGVVANRVADIGSHRSVFPKSRASQRKKATRALRPAMVFF